MLTDHSDKEKNLIHVILIPWSYDENLKEIQDGYMAYHWLIHIC